MNDWPIRSLHQIELTSRCNLRCVYCISPQIVDGKMKDRPSLDLTREHFLRALEWVKLLVKADSQGELNLAGTGESTMHPDFVEFVKLAREALGWDRRLCFATNGLLMTRELAKQIAPYQPTVWVSMHRPEKAKGAIDALKEFGLLGCASMDPAVAAVDWARQVDWGFTAETFGVACPWKKNGWAFVLADGRLSSCCFDDGSGVIGHVNDEIGSVRGKPYKLCKDCHQDVGADGFRDRVEGRVRR
jgi:hypothetical protein